jgi:hypothetical protein
MDRYRRGALLQGAIIERLKQDLHSKLAQQQKQIEALTAGLQKVNAPLATGRVRPIGGLEVSKPAPQTVSNNP